MGSRGAKCSRLRDSHEYADVIEIGRFAHAQCSSAAMIIPLGATPGTGGSPIPPVYCDRFQSRRQNQYRRTPLLNEVDVSSRVVGKPEVIQVCTERISIDKS